MKQKIKEALKQGHKKLGLSDEVFERVAASVETFITDESAIEGFVNSESTLSLLRSYQSINDKVRDLERFVPKPNNTPKVDEPDNGNNPPDPKPETPDIAALIEAALDKKLNPITERLNTFESTRAKETAVAALDKLCAEWDYAQGFPKERDEAKRIALKVYKAGGEQMTGEQLIAAFREEFDPAVKSKGVTDFSKPFQSDGAGGDNHKARFEEMAKRQEERQGAVAAN
ncbi:hypothetical protein [uncultured Muribaculum sp.]|uniref:hypothetical protein n=1 Tax=uncultured Muribaculum sp. TaxID=1918613 RepID=UPI0027312288|nr:hypothetical protein [uncultured Muribaculum sp.]